jgi:Zn-dependent M28 family amino/carboxypeptidase
MKKVSLSILVLTTSIVSYCQSLSVINKKEVQRIETILAADNMQGRETFTPSADKAADFIANEFAKIGLAKMKGLKTFKQTFTMIKPTQVSVNASFDSVQIDPKKIVVLTCLPNLSITPASGFKKIYIKPGADFRKEVSEYAKLSENLIVFIDSSFAQNFGRLQFLKRMLFKTDKSVVFVLGSFPANQFTVSAQLRITELQAANIVGVLPGKSPAKGQVIFSGHYDHLGIGKPENGDSIYNGANDDAAGITAVISLAKYFKAVKNNRRTIIFAAFAAEEIGGFGSQYFSKQLNPAEVVAMFNLEMIGTESKWGKNSAYITGYEKTNMGEILQKNLAGSKFRFHPDPYPEQQLFYRSDNATLARLGVAAHTISTSKMDSEPNYHKASDEVKTLDLDNMTEIIKAIATSAKTIISGKDTPTRVKAELLTR